MPKLNVPLCCHPLYRTQHTVV